MRILVCCSSGITSKILMKKLQRHGEGRLEDYQFESVNDHFLESRLDHCELALLAPHIEIPAEMIKKLEKQYQVRICRLDKELYAEMNPDRIFAYIKELLTHQTMEREEKRNWVVFVLGKISHLKYIQLMMETLMSVSSFVIFGSMLSLISLLPLGKSYQTFLSRYSLNQILRLPLNMISSSISLFILIAFCFHFSKREKTNAINLVLCTLTAYLIHLPNIFAQRVSWHYFGSDSVAYAFLICILSGEVYKFWKKRKKSKRRERFQFYQQAFDYMFVITIFFSARVMGELLHWDSLYELIRRIFEVPLAYLSTDVYSFLLFLLLGNVMWLLGIHGTSVAVMSILPLYSMIMNANLHAYLQGLPPIYPIWTFTHWCFIGGAGNLLALNILLLNSKDDKNRTVARYALPTSIFQIGEPLFFGVPIAYNPYFIIPFIVSPVMNAVICYLVFIQWEWVSLPLGVYLDNFYPVGMETVILTGGIAGWILYFVLLGLDILIYYPFYKLYDHRVQMKDVNC